jgi:glycosyltransferase involved in cell wall biosynthesis
MIEAHHLALQPPAIHQLIAQLDIPVDAYVHDYGLFCPRISLVNGHGRYCGEPELAGCEACVTGHGHFMAEQVSVESLRSRSAALLSSARRVVVPSDDAGVRLRRHFSELATETIRHEDDAAIALAGPPAAGRSGRATICVVGAIGVHKGYDVLLECAKDAACRGLDLTFAVVGHTIDDASLMDTGRVFVTGQFEPAEAVGLIAAQRATLGFVPSICPETWCLCLSDLWRAGLIAAAFDIGAQAERIRLRGQGILLPLGLPARAINDRLAAPARQRCRNDRKA